MNHKNFSQVLAQRSETSPDQMALCLLSSSQPDRAITYLDLLKGSLAYARALAQAGIQPGEIVVLILQHGESLPYAFFGSVLQGAVPSILPFLTEKLSPDQYRRALAALFEVTAPAAVITYPEFESEVLHALAGRPNGVRQILLDTQIQPVDEIDLQGLPGMERPPEEIVLLQHSSGTTGLQKGVALSHQAVFNQLDSLALALQLVPEDKIVSWLPLYHDMGLIGGFIAPILLGIPLVLMSPFDWVRAPHRLLQAVSNFRGTISWLPNFAFNFCAQKIQDRSLEGLDLSSWRAVINCSEPMFWRSMEMFRDRFRRYGLRDSALATSYAAAENVFAMTQGGITHPVTLDRIGQSAYLSRRIAEPAPAEEPSLTMVSAGSPILHTQLRILDEHHQDLPERHIGEIALQSNCMLSGYYHRTDATHKSFHQGWFLTGDLGYFAEGQVYITGRKKDLIIVGGKNIYPQDLENLACEVPGVHPGRVAAVGVINETAGTEDVVIIAEVEDQISASQEESEKTANTIRQYITRNSDISLRFVKLVARGWLLKTSSGKVARSANRDKYLAELQNQG